MRDGDIYIYMCALKAKDVYRPTLRAIHTRESAPVCVCVWICAERGAREDNFARIRMYVHSALAATAHIYISADAKCPFMYVHVCVCVYGQCS